MLTRERVLARLSSWFGLLALLLACVGLYGVMSYEVGRRVRDIGIRIALGAHPSAVQRQMLRRTAGLASLGILVGLAAAIVTTRVLSTLLYGVTPRDPVTLAGAAALLAVTCLLAGYLPARRAARVDPVAALRAD